MLARRLPSLLRPRLAVVALLLLSVSFGALVLFRATCLHRRMTDLGVYLRAAWAVRAGGDVYAVADTNGWHYHYPPLLAILLTPLAEPPTDEAALALPFAVSVVVWYAASVLFLLAGIENLARALEERSARPPDARRRLLLRAVPLLACLPAVGASLVRGQVDLLLLWLLCGMTAAALRGHRGRAGLWLAAAICLKVFPAFLLLVPLARRDGRWLGGCAAGLVVGLLVVPLLTMGPTRTMTSYRHWLDTVIRPGLGAGGDDVRARELTDIPSTDSQSFVAVLHNLRHPNRYLRPRLADPSTRLAHWSLGGLLALLTLAAARFGGGDGPDPAVRLALLIGGLTVVMLALSPVCHLHYFCLWLPLLMGLTAARRLPAGLVAVVFAAHVLPRLPGLEPLRDFGLAGLVGLLVWAVAIGTLAGHRVRVPDGCRSAAV